ncbi:MULTISPECIES: regulatory protein GemA [unclassified Variovorax]|uniref:regulatory protein GemA n=1 Tax=unclassified Variovorax TaxID=663243 RepID=UPI003F44EA84
MSKLARNHRNTDLAVIHMAKKHFKLTDEEYRTILLAQGGESSSSKLTYDGRQHVMAYFKGMGFSGKPFGQVEKIEWLWTKLSEAGALKDASKASLLAFVGRTANTEVSHLKFLPTVEASKVIEALKAILNRSTSKQ